MWSFGVHQLVEAKRLDARLGGDLDLARPVHGDQLECIGSPMHAEASFCTPVKRSTLVSTRSRIWQEVGVPCRVWRSDELGRFRFTADEMPRRPYGPVWGHPSGRIKRIPPFPISLICLISCEKLFVWSASACRSKASGRPSGRRPRSGGAGAC